MFHSLYSSRKIIFNYIISIFILYAIIWIIASFFNSSLAATNAADTYVHIEEKIHTIVYGWQDKIVKATDYLFFSLLIIGVVLNFGKMLVGSGGSVDLSAIAYDAIRIILVFGFFYWIMHNAQDLLDSLLGQFRDFADKVSGTGLSNPSELVTQAGEFSGKLIEQCKKEMDKIEFGVLDLIPFIGPMNKLAEIGMFFVNALFLLSIAIATWIVFVLVAFKMFLAAIGFHFLVYAGLFYVGFAGLELTREITVNYLRHLLGTAVTYYGMVLVAAIGVNLMTKLFGTFDMDKITFSNELAIITALIAFYMLVSTLPNALGSIVGGANVELGVTPAQAAGMAAAATGATVIGGAKVGGHVLGATYRTGKAVVQNAPAAAAAAGRMSRAAAEKVSSGYNTVKDKIDKKYENLSAEKMNDIARE